jgi:hypothetical protein
LFPDIARLHVLPSSISSVSEQILPFYQLNRTNTRRHSGTVPFFHDIRHFIQAGTVPLDHDIFCGRLQFLSCIILPILIL